MQTKARAGFQRLFEPTGGLRKYVAYELVRRCVVWPNHPMGEVRAPGFAERITGSHGFWSIAFGANSLDITRAVKSIYECTDRWASRVLSEPSAKEWNDLYGRCCLCIRQSVRNANGELYSLYPGTDRMAFGPHAIDLHDFLRELEQHTKLKEASLHARDRSRPDGSMPATKPSPSSKGLPQQAPTLNSYDICPWCQQSIGADRMKRHKRDRCPRKPPRR